MLKVILGDHMTYRVIRMGKPLYSAWVPIFWGKCRDLFTKNKAKHSSIPDLPSDIIINILTRLPANCIFQLWQTKNLLLNDLTTTSHFLRTHLDRAAPTIVVQSLVKSRDGRDSDNETKFFHFDGKAKATSFDLSSCNTADCNRRRFTLWGSYDGFLLLTSSFDLFRILNPITKEQVILNSPSFTSYVCGFYYHPHKKEYEVICVCYLGEQRIWDFEILNLTSNHRRSVGNYSFPPSRKRPPVFINNTFYWMVNWSMYYMANGVSPSLSKSILSFNLETQELGTIGIVQPFYASPQHGIFLENEFQLFELDGELSLFGTSSAKEVCIWVFNHNEKCWVKKQLITSPDHEQCWNFTSYFGDFEYIKMKGEFVAYDRWDKRKRPLAYNLRLGTWKLFQRKGLFAITSHTPSLVSLNTGNPGIRL